MDELSRFDPVPPHFPRARVTDASSSHQAAAIQESTGKAKADAALVLEALRGFPNCTTRELAVHARLDRYMVARRMPELAEAGLATRHEPGKGSAPCSVTKRVAIRWRPVS